MLLILLYIVFAIPPALADLSEIVRHGDLRERHLFIHQDVNHNGDQIMVEKRLYDNVGNADSEMDRTLM